jgi:hypothetical protein
MHQASVLATGTTGAIRHVAEKDNRPSRRTRDAERGMIADREHP